ncbi:TetR/AcrR family transcriptional regulator [Mycolicibacterium wolinskyi]|uniref:HTH tetR-type domain-containing protein n=1 Tax=Mycolicibacterium wolinskyi TaxID=59750 RepID=A0A1X2FKB0_9MYCO|nr:MULTISPECIES: TetR/AcrR family transcriptional regulator [Mycolicibacterium]MCV7289523.1 TetR/AcrR family transcriptional regulator [Mycolicibacterium wolinskyi]MCV7297517.1 TetR/AcrR family transcriptional regulator [Mycolicibacterium goodii]ORX18864.1 hypothetical protein AWC31_12980 [Mycolicibacterium wolinskyi]
MREPVGKLSPALLAATVQTLRQSGPRQFSLTAVADAAGVSRGTVHNALGNREWAIEIALGHLTSGFLEALAVEVQGADTLANYIHSFSPGALPTHSLAPPDTERSCSIRVSRCQISVPKCQDAGPSFAAQLMPG